MADVAEIRQHLADFDFTGLFIESLGWDRWASELRIDLEGVEYELKGIAEKRGFQVFLCKLPAGAGFPVSAECNRIQRQVAKSAHENLIVFVDAERTRQSWKWGKRDQGRLLRSRGADFHRGQSGEALAQRLLHLAVTIEEEDKESFSLVDVTQRVRAAFDVDRVTKSFYGKFREEHTAFLGFVIGIKAVAEREWYASLMLNRLMFVYFIQKKGFLDGDRNYLQNRLRQTQEVKGKDKFHSFYRYFLLRLFHEGFGQRESERTAELEKLIGTVPYLNGGLFDVHELEHANPDIQIKDEAFERLFAFFDRYQWHLDDRPLRNDNEINPDVLGYIFEKYINQKQMGAYYTKEDVTEYISKNTIIPYLFDAAANRCAVGLQSGAAAWQLLADNPDRYIYDAVGHGVFVDVHTGERLAAPRELPAEISRGIDDVSQRSGWNVAAPPELALPTETWRELVARRGRCEELRQKLAEGGVHTINDLVTLNLNIRQFAQDVIEQCEGPELLRAFYYTIAGRIPQKSNERFQRGVSVLDPTCGSGAFLFAALNILRPLYEACLERMQQFVDEAHYSVVSTPEDQLDELIAQGESRTVEFKQSARWDVKQAKANKEMEKVIVKTVAAMLNTEGGDLLIGVHDDGSATGVEVDYQLMGKQGNRDGYENWLTTLLVQTSFGKHTSPFIRVSFIRKDGKEVCRVSVAPSPKAVFVKEGNDEQLYIRAGNSSRLLTAKETVEYHQHRFDGAGPIEQPKPAVKKAAGASRYGDLRAILASADRHPSRAYFIHKAIIINNLFGVDIMPEAVEICKLRLFLQLVSTVERVDQLEPLPDIDFNIRVGNTLVGFATLQQVRDAAEKFLGGQRKLGFSEAEEEIQRINEAVEVVDRQFQQFRLQQTQLGGAVTHEDKIALVNSLQTLSEELSKYLAREYDVDPEKARPYAKWLELHAPFHWLVQFYSIIASGGFDVIVGNPPYIESAKVRRLYRVIGYRTESCTDIYAWCLERVAALASPQARTGMIVPLSLAFSRSFDSCRRLLDQRYTVNWYSSYGRIPAALFAADVRVRNVIHLGASAGVERGSFTTRLHRWFESERPHLVQRLEYASYTPSAWRMQIPKLGSQPLIRAFESLATMIDGGTIANSMGRADSKDGVHFKKSAYNWLTFCDTLPPCFDGSGNAIPHTKFGRFGADSAADRDILIAVLNGKLMLAYWMAIGDDFDLSQWMFAEFPVSVQLLNSTTRDVLIEKGSELRQAMQSAITYKLNAGKNVGNYNLAACRRITDESDSTLLEALGLSNIREDLELLYVQTVRSPSVLAGGS